MFKSVTSTDYAEGLETKQFCEHEKLCELLDKQYAWIALSVKALSDENSNKTGLILISERLLKTDFKEELFVAEDLLCKTWGKVLYFQSIIQLNRDPQNLCFNIKSLGDMQPDGYIRTGYRYKFTEHVYSDVQFLKSLTVQQSITLEVITP